MANKTRAARFVGNDKRDRRCRVSRSTTARARRGRPAANRSEPRNEDAPNPTPEDHAVTHAHETRSSKSAQKSSDDSKRQSHLATYFNEVGRHDVLTPDEEHDLAVALENREVDLWVAILSYPPVVDFVCDTLQRDVENPPRKLKSVRTAAAAARRDRSKASRNKLHRVAHAAGVALRECDRDGEHVDAMINELRRIRASETPRIGPKGASFAPTSAAYGKYLRHVGHAELEATELRNRFIEANLRLVVTVARRYNHGQMPLPDLIQEGNVGLMKAVRRFDHGRGFRFSTYASWWIRHAIGRALADKGRAVRVPVHMIDTLHRLTKAQQDLHMQLGRAPTNDELAEAAEVPADKIEKLQLYMLGQSVSLDRPIGDEEDRPLVEVFRDPHADETPLADKLADQALAEAVRQVVDELSPMEADIVRRRFGLENDEESTLAELGQRYELSRERIRQIQNQALSKLRRTLERRQLV